MLSYTRERRTGTSGIIEMGHVSHSERIFDCLDSFGVLASEDLIDMTDDGLNISRTVLRHVLADGFEVPPEVPFQKHCQE